MVDGEKRVVRKTYGAGRWFPASRQELKSEVDICITAADVPEFSAPLVGGIAPHAGYIYSGKVAGYTFRALQESATAYGAPETVVILGFCHSLSFSGVALLDGDAVITPAGEITLDRQAGQLMADSSSSIYFDYRPHMGEHSAENQIPFVQCALPDAALVVALFGDRSADSINAVAGALEQLSGQKKIAVIASTDLLHDPDYDKVRISDQQTLAMIAALDSAGLADAWTYENQVCCGISPVLTLMEFARRAGRKSGRIPAYRNSGDDYPESRGSWVVGYGSVVF